MAAIEQAAIEGRGWEIEGRVIERAFGTHEPDSNKRHTTLQTYSASSNDCFNDILVSTMTNYAKGTGIRNGQTHIGGQRSPRTNGHIPRLGLTNTLGSCQISIFTPLTYFPTVSPQQFLQSLPIELSSRHAIRLTDRTRQLALNDAY